MRPLLVIAGVCAFVSAQTFKSSVDEVAVPVTIQGEPAHAGDIGPDDFRVFDDGRPVPIVTFGKIRQSVHVVLLLDTSRSMAQSLDDVRAAADAVIARLAPGDFIQVGTFSSILRLSPSFTADDKKMVSRLPFVAGENMTMLYDALLEGCSAFTSESGRRVIIVVSDGLDTASSGTTRTVMERAAEANVSIYAVGVDSRSTEGSKSILRAPDPSLREIAEDTGGTYVYAGGGRDYSRSFAAMIEELHQQYMLGFTPALADGRLHSLQVTTRRPNVKIRARKHYLAPTP